VLGMTNPSMSSLAVLWLSAAELQHWRRETFLLHAVALQHSAHSSFSCTFPHGDVGLQSAFLEQHKLAGLFMCSVAWHLVIMMGGQIE